MLVAQVEGEVGVRDVEGKVTDVERRIKESGMELPSSNGRSRSYGLR